MADPTKYTPGYDFSNYQANQPNKPLPGQRVDIELADIADSLDSTIEALKDVRRADGKLQNGIVDADSFTQDIVDDLAQDVIAAVGPAAEASIQAALPDWRGGWLTATAYAVNDLVREDGSAYICLAAHTSGTFTTDLAAGRWELFAQRGAAGAGTGDMLGANNLSDVTDVAVARSNIGLGGDILPAIAGLNTSAGFLVQTGASTAGKRSMAGTANQIAVANPDGSGGNPTFSLVLPSQAEAEAGADNNKPMTALRVAQAITAQAGGTVSYQAFTSSGTWTKPANCKMVYVELWGGGGGGATNSNIAGGGGGGGFVSRVLRASDLGATVTVTVGAGGAGGVPLNISPGSDGGSSSFGSIIAQGGKGSPSGAGFFGRDAGDGGDGSKGASTTGSGPAYIRAAGSISGGGGLGSSDPRIRPGANCTYGGGGGGGGGDESGAGGVSAYGGNGGSGSTSLDNPAASGSAPGGGGGGSRGGGGGAGARGEVRVWAW